MIQTKYTVALYSSLYLLSQIKWQQSQLSHDRSGNAPMPTPSKARYDKFQCYPTTGMKKITLTRGRPPPGVDAGQKSVHVQEGIICNIGGCTRIYATKWELMAHQLDSGHLGNYCPMCDQWCSTKGTIKRHIRTVHGEQAWRCRYCGKTFNRQDNLRTHQASVHGDSSEY